MPFSLAIHGGAGTMRRDAMTPDLEAAHHAGLRAALWAGFAVLAAGGTALDAVTRAVMALEDDPLFNAGHGAVFTSAGTLEMDAAAMDGRTRAAGAVAGVLGPRNPILAARAVMERSGAVLLAGEGALAFCREAGVAFEDPAYFHTDRRWDALQAELERRGAGAPDTRDDAARHGTVGAVACDAAGHLAAATSTGGMTGKRPGRVGDCPVFGAGHLGGCELCRVRNGHGRGVHPPRRRARDRRPHPAGWADAGAGRGRRGGGAEGGRRRRWADCGGRGGWGGAAVQLRGHVPRHHRPGRRGADGDLRRGDDGLSLHAR